MSASARASTIRATANLKPHQTLPWSYKAWHAGGTANSTHIGVEMTEPASIRYQGGATFVDNDPAATGAHIHDTYKTAVELFAHLCNLHGLDPLGDGVIISHSEGHRRGLASNHADVEHLWSAFGLTMDGFRRDVRSAMANGVDAGDDSDEYGCPHPQPVRDIGRGDRGSDVCWVQWRLDALGYGIGSAGIDGVCGGDTVAAILAFQRDRGLEADGICGANTRAALNAAMAEINQQTGDEEMSMEQFRAYLDELDPVMADLDAVKRELPALYNEVKTLVDIGAIQGDGTNRIGKRKSQLEATVLAVRAQALLDPVYRELEDVPDYWREETGELIATGALEGDGIDSVAKSRSVLSAAVISKRYTDCRLDER